MLTHWGRVTHICVSKLTIIGSYDGLSSDRRQAIIRTNAGILLIQTLGTNFSGILSEIHTFSLKKCIWKRRLRNGGHFASISMSPRVKYVPRKVPDVRSRYALYTNMRRFVYWMLHFKVITNAPPHLRSEACHWHWHHFPHLEEHSSVTTYLGKLIIHIVLLQHPNTMYPFGIEVSNDTVISCGDGSALQHTPFQNKFMRRQAL